MKRRATGLLVLAAVVFAVARSFEDGHGWVGYVRATAEAAMVGGVADWFAVTALFRHPFGLRIPHTAIIPTRKDALGRGLGAFVQQNFLEPEAVAQKVANARPVEKVAAWLRTPSGAQAVADGAAGLLAAGVGALDDREVQALVGRLVHERVERIPAAPVAGRVLAAATAEGRHEELVEAALGRLTLMLHDNRDVLREHFGREAPRWMPGMIEDRLFDRLYGGFQGLLLDVRLDRSHPLRRQLHAQVVDLGERLQHDPDLLARGEELKAELLAHPAFRRWTGSLWADIRATVLEQAGDADSPLRLRLRDAAGALGGRLEEDGELRATASRWIARGVATVVDRHGHEVADLISTTVERWDAREAADRIEAQVGRDLQFIRINGTLVGGLVGLLLHVVSQLWG